MRIDPSRLVLAAVLLAACELKEDAPPARRDAGGSGVAEARAPAPDSLGMLPIDTIATAPERSGGVLEASGMSGGSEISGRSDASSGSVVPGGSDIADGSDASAIAGLRLGIVVPVRGIAPNDLRDTYTESRGSRLHEALDIPAPRGTPVVSAAAGRVVQLHDSKAGGLMVYAADPGDRFILLYGHLDSYAPGLRVGMPLAAGQQIGAVGTTGNAPPGTPHLHFAVLRGTPSSQWWRGSPINPYLLFHP